MSFDIEWNKCNKDYTNKIFSSLKLFFNEYINEVLPVDHFIKSMYIENISLSTSIESASPLKVAINDIAWPWPCFYHSISSSHEHIQQNPSTSNGHTYTAHSSLPGTPISNSSKTVQSISPRQSSLATFSYSHQLTQLTDMKHINDIQLELDLFIHSPLKIQLKVELQLNHPMPSFVHLPISLCIDQIDFSGKLLLVYINDTLSISILKKGDTLPFHFDIHMDVSLGEDQDSHKLKHVTKVQQFILEQLIDWLKRDLLFPNFYRIKAFPTQ